MPITLSGVNLKTKVETLKQEAAEKWNLPKDSFGKNDCALFGDWSLLRDFLIFDSKFNVGFFELFISEMYIKAFRYILSGSLDWSCFQFLID